MKITCGVFVYNKDTKSILLVHPTNNSWKSWSIPKGEIEEEAADQTSCCKQAVIELWEETNLDFNYFPGKKYVREIEYKTKKKKLIAWLLIVSNFIIDEYNLKCNSLTKGQFPEVDSFIWSPFGLAKILIHESQIELLSKVIKIIEEEKL